MERFLLPESGESFSRSLPRRAEVHRPAMPSGTNPWVPKVRAPGCALLALLLTLAGGAQAESYLHRGHSIARSTHLIEITRDTPLSLKIRGARAGGFETSRGDWVGFGGWYSARWKDMRMSWMTQITPHFGVIWGFSSGERAEKYRIDPGLRLGFLFQVQPGRHSLLSLNVSTTLGGRLREKTCTADYGDIGGVQKVNCRLAASTLEPSRTLAYLYDEKPSSGVQVRYRLNF